MITEQNVWEAVNGGLPNWSWWHSFEWGEDTDWDKPGTITVVGEDPDYDEGTAFITKTFTAKDLVDAFNSMESQVHCGGCHLIEDPDDCSSDLILQQAMYGEIVFG
jgi:hypothetical protein